MSDEDTGAEKFVVLVLGLAWTAITVAIDGGILLVAWDRLAVPFFHPAFHLTYAAACAADVLRSVLLMGHGQLHSKKEESLKQAFANGVARGIAFRIMTYTVVVVSAWILT